MGPGAIGDRRLELYVRSLSDCPEGGTDHARHVRALERDGAISDADVTVWGTEVGLSTTALRTPAGRAILDRLATFRAWADDHGATMAPFFETRTVTGKVTGESYSAVRLPVSCLAEYEGDELVHIAPHRRDETECNVADRLRMLSSLLESPDDIQRAIH